MNVEISGAYQNGYAKPDFKDKESGEIRQGDYVIQIQQRKELSNGTVQLENLDIPIDRALEKNYVDIKVGNAVKVPCNVYGENFAQIKVSKAK